LYVQDAAPNRTRFVIVGLNQGSISQGSLTDIVATARPGTPPGVFHIQISGISVVYGNGALAPSVGISSNATVGTGSASLLPPVAVQNAASFVSASVSPGAILTLRAAGIGPSDGQVPRNRVTDLTLGGTSVAFDDIPAPLLYAGPNQINVIAPWAVTGATTRITVTRNGGSVAAVSVPVSSASPGIFTLSQGGTGGGAVLNQDSSVNSPLNPAGAGSIISIYGTGIGPVDPASSDGVLSGFAQARIDALVTIGGAPAEVLYAGSAPGLVSGVFQINCRIPADVTGQAVEVVVESAGSRSASGVTIAIQ
jgi:uncharacterized protein (TIGR03437 family)